MTRTRRSCSFAKGLGAPLLWRVALAICVAGAASGVRAQDAPPPPPPPPEPPPEAVVEPLERYMDDNIVLSDEQELRVAPDSLVAREAPADVLARYRNDPDFQYDSPEAEGPTLWDRLKRWFARNVLAPIFDGVTSEGGSNIIILLAILALGWVVMRLLRADMGPLFGRKDLSASGAEAGPLLDVEDILEVDVSALLADALARGDLRDAVRFRYVLALQSLAKADAIRWRRDTTNREYVQQAREAGGGALAGPFADATRAFDYVWYGERAVDRARYNRLEPLFERMDAALRAPRQRPEPA